MFVRVFVFKSYGVIDRFAPDFLKQKLIMRFASDKDEQLLKIVPRLSHIDCINISNQIPDRPAKGYYYQYNETQKIKM
jgi:hypothetical protein